MTIGGVEAPDPGRDASCGDAADPGPTAIACSLGADDAATRLDEWREVLAHVTARGPVDGGVRLTLAPDAPVPELARLAVAEQACCPFFSFALIVDAVGAALEVRAPAHALPFVHGLFGT